MNIYLLKSDSYRLLNKQIERILEGVENITTFSLNDVTIFDCIEDAQYYGLFQEQRAIVIKDVKFFGGKYLYEEETSALYSFLQKKEEDLFLLFICDDIKKTKDITKKVIALGAKIEILGSLTDEELKEYVDSYASEENLLLDAKARDLILKNVVSNLDIALQEIDKLSLVDHHITESIVSTYGSVEENDETFAFSNAVVSKNFTEAFRILDKLLSNGVDAFSLIGLLASSFTNMYMVRDAINHGLSDEEIAKSFGYSSTSRVYVMKKNAKIYTMEQLKEIILSLSDLDIKIKTGSNPAFKIKEFLLNL